MKIDDKMGQKNPKQGIHFPKKSADWWYKDVKLY